MSDPTLRENLLRALRAQLSRVNGQIAAIERLEDHISDHDLERYHLGMVTDEAELALLEEHILACNFCAEQAEAAAEFVDTIRAAIIEGDWDQDL